MFHLHHDSAHPGFAPGSVLVANMANYGTAVDEKQQSPIKWRILSLGSLSPIDSRVEIPFHMEHNIIPLFHQALFHLPFTAPPTLASLERH